MKAFANICVLAAVVGVIMVSETAKADFNNEQVAETAEFIADGVATIDNAELRDLGVPRGERVVFLAAFRSIGRDCERIVELADGPDNQVEDDIEDLARNVKRTVDRLADRAEDINNVDLDFTLDTINAAMNKILQDVD